MLARVVGNDLDGFLLADELAIEAMLAVFNILDNRLSVFLIPANYIDKASLVAKLAANAFLREKINAMISVDHSRLNLHVKE